MASVRYSRLCGDLRYGSVIPWRSSRAQMDGIIRMAAEALWPQLVSRVDNPRYGLVRQLMNGAQ